ncbi:hypothetical protein [Paenarthrobacter sp. CAP02]|uniref:hypothetical protein n=1 Tax=Paenarthrobacter sp. CAP02 TaxID=3158144 RepID=UPI0032DA3ED6
MTPADLSRRLTLLLDVVEVERGRPVTFREIRDALADRGVTLSRARWFYMKDGTGRLVTDAALLDAVSDLLSKPGYLRNGGDFTEQQLAAVRHLRAQRVSDYATKQLADIAPELLQDIEQAITNDRRRSE